MDWLVFALIAAIPASVVATAFRWLSIEYGLCIIWAAVLVTFALGLWSIWRPNYRDV